MAALEALGEPDRLCVQQNEIAANWTGVTGAAARPGNTVAIVSIDVFDEATFPVGGLTVAELIPALEAVNRPNADIEGWDPDFNLGAMKPLTTFGLGDLNEVYLETDD